MSENSRSPGRPVGANSASVDAVLDRHGLEPYLDAPAELHGVLRSPFRKRVLLELDESDGSLPAGELAERLSRSDAVDATDASDVLVRLWHIHIPKLESCGLIKVYKSDSTKLIEPDF